MFEHKKIKNLSDFYKEMKEREEKGVYFYRICGYNETVGEFIRAYYDMARRSGVVIEGKIPNPSRENLAYYEEILGMDFRLEKAFLSNRLGKWLPRLSGYQKEALSEAVYDTLMRLRNAGKNDGMLKNAYIKFMCWLYYKFERIVSCLGENSVPKILYEGSVSSYELLMLSVLSRTGCDIVLLEYQGDGAYLKEDPASLLSDLFSMEGLMPFTADFSLKKLRERMQEELFYERIYGGDTGLLQNTNAWITGNGFSDILTEPGKRGTDLRYFYNCFLRIVGVEDKISYPADLYKLQKELKNRKRNLVAAEKELPVPTPQEIAGIRRGNGAKIENLISDLAANITCSAGSVLPRIMKKAFVDLMLEEAGAGKVSSGRLTKKAVYLLCWLNRYKEALFKQWKMPEIGCFLYLGGCNNEEEAFFLRFLARLPADVLILVPDLQKSCVLKDKNLYEIHYGESLELSSFPMESSVLQAGTAAYHAERELDSSLYEGSGLYRNMQYDRAVSVTLKTMYEEIKLLWDQEVVYRSYFEILDKTVHIPVICAKISGVDTEKNSQYFAAVRKLITEDTFVIKKAPYLLKPAVNAAPFLKNRKLQRDKIKKDPGYSYGMLREERQEYILDKLQLLLDQEIIKGTFQNGMEYAITAAVLRLPKEILRLIQKFDFTKKNPKLIYIHAAETQASLEDSILTAFLNLIGFDILVFVPTGYQSVEQYFQKNIMEEHQIGEYRYDLQVPDFDKGSAWYDKLFRRGRER